MVFGVLMVGLEWMEIVGIAIINQKKYIKKQMIIVLNGGKNRMRKYKKIPIVTARRIAKQYNKNQVIIVTWDSLHSKTHVTTYGKTLKECEEAAKSGNLIKKALGWPDNLCHTVPARIKRKQLTISQISLRSVLADIIE